MTHRVAAPALGATAALTIATLRRMRREFEAAGELTPPTVAAMYTCYTVHATATAQAARHRAGPLPIPSPLALCAGGALVAGGTAACVAGMRRFAGAGQISGTDVGELMTGGIYRCSRNPQYTGYIAILTGLGLARRSAAVIALASAAALAFCWWVPVEERHLKRAFGVAYCRYRDQAPRWLGPPRT